MRVFLAVLAVGLFAALVAAFESKDFEVFDLVDALETAEGKGVDVRSYDPGLPDAGILYGLDLMALWLTGPDSYLNLTASATTADISRAYRRRSLELHPDKNPNVPLIHERFARLGVIANLLRDDEQRKRYDHWRKVGVPKWRGTGYYYSRYRPGLPLVLLGITLATCVFQYAAQWLSRIGDVGRVNDLRDRARAAAYGAGEAAASATERKRVRIPMRAGDDEMPRKNRPMLTVVVEGQQMTAVYDDGAEVPLDSRSVPKPQLLATWVPALLRALAGRVVSRQLPAAPAAIEELAPPYELAPPPRTASPAGGVQRRKGQPRRK